MPRRLNLFNKESLGYLIYLIKNIIHKYIYYYIKYPKLSCTCMKILLNASVFLLRILCPKHRTSQYMFIIKSHTNSLSYSCSRLCLCWLIARNKWKEAEVQKLEYYIYFYRILLVFPETHSFKNLNFQFL